MNRILEVDDKRHFALVEPGFRTLIRIATFKITA